MSSQTPISVIVTVLNESQTVGALLTALLHQSYPIAQAIVVDGGSHDETVSQIKKFENNHPTFPLLYLTKVGNRSVGRNTAIQKAKTELIAITDAGCLPHPDWLEQLVKTHRESDSPVVAGYYDALAKTPFEAAVVPYVLVPPDKVNPKTFLPATRSMLLKKSVWKEVGGFDETLADNEDYAFAQQLKKRNIPIAFAAAAQVTWKPRSSLTSFVTMIRRFAQGDAYAGLWRPKVALIFARYLAAVLGLAILIWENQRLLAINLGIVGAVLYSYWAIRKNIKYVGSAWYWLPVLQVVSDWAVMGGTLQGLIKKVFKFP